MRERKRPYWSVISGFKKGKLSHLFVHTENFLHFHKHPNLLSRQTYYFLYVICKLYGGLLVVDPEMSFLIEENINQKWVIRISIKTTFLKKIKINFSISYGIRWIRFHHHIKFHILFYKCECKLSDYTWCSVNSFKFFFI